MARKITQAARRARTAPPQKTAAAAAARRARPREEEVVENIFLGVLLFFLAVLVFVPVFNAGFIWDDDQLLTANNQVHSLDGWWTLWLKPETADYFPLTSTTLWIEWRWWGMMAGGYHVTNVLLHAAAAVLSWQTLKRLHVPGAWVAAAIFAVHPVCVESVAWISERKNTISQIFFLLSIIHYVRFEEKERLWRYVAAVICFALSLLAKTATVMLPVILLLLAWWRYRELQPLRQNYELAESRVERGILLWSCVAAGLMAAGALLVTVAMKESAVQSAAVGAAMLNPLFGTVEAFAWYAQYNYSGPGTPRLLAATLLLLVGGGSGYAVGLQLRKVRKWSSFAGFELIRTIPFFLVALLLGAVTIYFQYGRAIGGEEIPIGNMWQRMASACFAAGFYLYSALWPFNLIEIYPQWHRAFSMVVYQPRLHVEGPAPEAIPYWKQVIPGLLIAGLLFYCWMRRTEQWARALLVGLGSYFIAMLPALGLLTMSYMRLTLVADHFQYISIISVIALVVGAGYSRSLKPVWMIVAAAFFLVVSFLNWDQTADNHLWEVLWIAGAIALAAGSGAAREYWRFIWGGFLVAVILAFSFISWKQSTIYQSEKTLWTATLEKNPTSWQAHNHLGAALYMEKNWVEAGQHFLRATQLKQENPESHNNLGLFYSMEGDMKDAITQYQIAVGIKDDSSMETNLGNAYEQVKQYDDAIRTYKHAIDLNQDNPSAHCNLGYALMQEGRVDEAISEFIKTIQLDPGMQPAKGDLAEALKLKGINLEAPDLSGTYGFDLRQALQLLQTGEPRPQQQQQ